MVILRILLPLLFLSLDTAAQRKARIIRGPYLQSLTSHSLVLRWRTDVPDRSIVYYGVENCEQLFSAADSQYKREHIIQLDSLTPSTLYYYSIHGDRKLQGDCRNYFKTLPPPGSEGLVRIVAFGDCGNNSINQRKVRNEILDQLDNKHIDAWLLLGDNAYQLGRDVEYQYKFFDIYQRSMLKRFGLFPSPGNHDYAKKPVTLLQAMNSLSYFKSFSLPVKGEAGGQASNNPAYYAFDVGNVHFLSLDSYGLGTDGKRIFDTTSLQVQWIKKDLDSNRQKWVVAYWHHPPYTMGSHNSDREMELVFIRQNFIPVLERYGVDLVLTGHSHNYERSKLMSGHYGPEISFDAGRHFLSQASGKYPSFYKKDSTNRGTVYVVSGSAGQRDAKIQPGYPHNAMPYSYYTRGGSLLIEVNGKRMDVFWVMSNGKKGDEFTIIKD